LGEQRKGSAQNMPVSGNKGKKKEKTWTVSLIATREQKRRGANPVVSIRRTQGKKERKKGPLFLPPPAGGGKEHIARYGAKKEGKRRRGKGRRKTIFSSHIQDSRGGKGKRGAWVSAEVGKKGKGIMKSTHPYGGGDGK